MVGIRQNLVASNMFSIKCPYAMSKPKSITIHNTANDASAENEIAYMIRNGNKVSFHYAVDDKEIVQGIADNRNAWHCGNTTGNRNSLSIEICYSKSGGERFTKAEENAAEFVAAKLKEYGLKLSDVTTHKAWNGKDCPHRTLSLGWERFIKMIQKYYDGSNSAGNNSSSGSNTGSGSKVSGVPDLSGYTGSSIVDGLKSVGYDSTMSSRKALAAKLGISNYTGTASQNTQLLKLLKGNSSSNNSSGSTTTGSTSGLPDLSSYKGSSIVDGLKSVGYDSGTSSRKALAAKLGINNYTGTAAQNTQMLKMLR